MGEDRRTYVCTTPCYHYGSKYKRGDVVAFLDSELPRSKEGEIRHFVPDGPTVRAAAPPPDDIRKPRVTVNNKKK